jgi:hypothetical protein
MVKEPLYGKRTFVWEKKTTARGALPRAVAVFLFLLFLIVALSAAVFHA